MPLVQSSVHGRSDLISPHVKSVATGGGLNSNGSFRLVRIRARKEIIVENVGMTKVGFDTATTKLQKRSFGFTQNSKILKHFY